MHAAFRLAIIFVLAAAPATADNTSAIVQEGIVNASVSDVWHSWTTVDGLRSWLAPHVAIELRIGGLMRTNYHPDGQLGDPRTIENIILSFEPMRMLSIKVTKAPAEFPFPRAIQDMWTNVYFEPVGSKQTRVRIVGSASEATRNRRGCAHSSTRATPPH